MKNTLKIAFFAGLLMACVPKNNPQKLLENNSENLQSDIDSNKTDTITNNINMETSKLERLTYRIHEYSMAKSSGTINTEFIIKGDSLMYEYDVIGSLDSHREHKKRSKKLSAADFDKILEFLKNQFSEGKKEETVDGTEVEMIELSVSATVSGRLVEYRLTGHLQEVKHHHKYNEVIKFSTLLEKMLD